MGEVMRADFTLEDRYQKDSGVIFLSGIQALVRTIMEQRRLDERAGFSTGGFISGYRGSPLGGLDQQLWQHRDALEAINVHFQPGVNEELAATAVWGSQQVGLFPGATVQGVFGLWYGKAPGLDRACDAIRHANAAGTSPLGGVLLVVGDDHGCKSSTLPSASELALKDLGIPVLNPADVQDVLDFGMFGWAMSRYSGCWSSMIALADTMDSAATVTADAMRGQFILPEHEHDVHITTGRAALDQEILLHEVKLPLAIEFARANGINRLISNPAEAGLGIVTTGKAYLDVRQALEELGLPDAEAISRAGIRLLKLGMSWPLDAREIASFTSGLETVVVVEEKRAFVEEELKQLLYSNPGPRIVGKRTAEGEPALSATGELGAGHVAQVLASYLPQSPDSNYVQRVVAANIRLAAVEGQAKTDRLPMFCAGCPHNTSTRVPDGSRASAGIGCHYMAQWMDRETSTFTQMGGEGANWTGQAPFTDEDHIFVNLGDGTYFHSGLLAVRQAVASGVNVTYKLLYNDAVAMTGGQPVDGDLTVPQLVAQLQAEGVTHVEVVSDQPGALPAMSVPVSHRDQLDEIQRRCRKMTGCSVIVYQQTCATELRRRRKRGLAEDPDVRVVINDAVCEGCGDCSVVSNCVAVEPLPTAFGIKRRVNQTACNKDLSCVDGFCPAFVLVKGGKLKKPEGVDIDLDSLRAGIPQPKPKQDSDSKPVNLLVAGVGGTGVVTVSALIGTAAHLDGKAASTLDMTGLAQKGGAVFGHIRIAPSARQLHGTRIAPGKADLLLGCDLITGASKDALRLMADDITTAVVNTHVVPTAEFVLHQQADTHDAEKLARVESFSAQTRTVDAEAMVSQLLGGTATLNIFLLGYAYQLGTIPVSLAALERAIALNGVAIEDNLKSFHFGRMAAWDVAKLELDSERSRQASDTMDSTFIQEDLEGLISERIGLLECYQGESLAQRFENLVRKTQVFEEKVAPSNERLTKAVAQSYAKLLAYKDEYEVGRLYTDGRWQAKLDAMFEGAYSTEYLLAPPTLGSRKRSFGAWMGVCFALLSRCRFLRGTVLDPFNYTAERKQERWMISHFEDVVAELSSHLNVQNHGLAVRIVELVLSVRGFGHVKEAAMERWLKEESALLEMFREPPAPVALFDPDRRDKRNAA